jgi:hypothetical protein
MGAFAIEDGVAGPGSATPGCGWQMVVRGTAERRAGSRPFGSGMTDSRQGGQRTHAWAARENLLPTEVGVTRQRSLVRAQEKGLCPREPALGSRWKR